MTKRSKLSGWLPNIILILIGVIFAVPLLWLLLAAFDAEATLAVHVPKHFTLSNFSSILGDSGNQRSFLNGIYLSLGQAILVLIVSALAAYPLSRYEMSGKRTFLYVILFCTGLPITAVMVPVYQLFVFFNFQDSLFWTLVFQATSVLPFSIWMMKNFMDSIPVDLEESAWVDGASSLQALGRIIMPLMLPGLFTVLISAFSSSWGNFLVPFILIQSPEKLPASVTIFQFFGQYGMVQYGKLAAFSTLYTLPAIVLYVIGQKYMSTGFTMSGANKG